MSRLMYNVYENLKDNINIYVTTYDCATGKFI